MSRFDRLEFDTSPAGRHSLRVVPMRDECYWREQADRQRRSGEYETALRCYSRALENNHTLVAAWVGQTQMLILLDETPEAQVWCRKALELFPGTGELLAAQAQAACRLGKHAQAFAESDAAMAARGHSAYRWQVRGEVLLATEQMAAMHCFERATQASADWLVELETALILLRYRRTAQALVRARLATSAAPDAAYAWLVRGRAEMLLGASQQARVSLTRCLELCSGHIVAGQYLAQLARSAWSPRAWLRSWLSQE